MQYKHPTEKGLVKIVITVDADFGRSLFVHAYQFN